MEVCLYRWRRLEIDEDGYESRRAGGRYLYPFYKISQVHARLVSRSIIAIASAGLPSYFLEIEWAKI